MNIGFEHIANGRVQISRRANNETTYPLSDEISGISTDQVEWDVRCNDDEAYDTPFDGVTIELQCHHLNGTDKSVYSTLIQAQLAWQEAIWLHDFLGLLIRTTGNDRR